MSKNNWQETKAALEEVLAASTPDRDVILARLDTEIRCEVEALLECEDAADGLMELSAVEFAKELIVSEGAGGADDLSGRTVGAYRILSELGAGGMGAVYLAERTDGKFTRRAAVKLLRREMNTKAFRNRFEREREILASLEHPNIARFLDAGSTDDGIPFLALEYVEGVPIDEFCESRALGLEDRIDLFKLVCNAVDFAHRNLIVHRDLKPSNILVDADGVPKLLDFGISKIVSARIASQSTATVTKLGAMTPSYSSPEQLDGKSVTTATDIYSLGVILYQIMSGHRPFEADESNFPDLCRAVRETEPVPPSSVAVSSRASVSVVVADNIPSVRRTKQRDSMVSVGSAVNPALLAGDLDNIVLKALRKEPERRYSSAGNFAEDLERYQKGLPVTARPNTLAYRAEKFVKRNRTAVLAAALVTAALVVGFVATLWQSEVAKTERNRARIEADKSKTINLYLQNVLSLSNPLWMSANPESNLKATVAEAVDEAARTVESDLAGQPEIQAEIHYTLGKTYIGQGQYEKGQAQLRKARERFLQSATDNTAKVMQINSVLGLLAYFEGSESDGEELLANSVAYFRANLDGTEDSNKWFAMSLNDLASMIARKGKTAESEQMVRESLDYAQKLNGQNRWSLVNIINNLGDMLVDLGRLDEAIPVYQSAIDEGLRLSDRPRAETANNYYDLGRIYKKQRKFAAAQENIFVAYKIFKETLGEENLYTAMTHKQIAELYFFQGDYAKARAEIDDVIRVLNKTNPEKPNLYNNYAQQVSADILTKTGAAPRAEAIMREVIVSYGKLLESPHLDIAIARRSLGESLIAQKKTAEARLVLTDSVKEFVASVGEGNPETQKCVELLNSLVD